MLSVQCPRCGVDDDKVIDSRSVDEGRSIRRRRSCGGCDHRFTTFERIETVNLAVIKRSGDRMPFDPVKIIDGVRAAGKNRPVSEAQIESVAIRIEERARSEGVSIISTEQIGIEVLEALGAIDEVAYLRFASVYKEFSDASDFAREVRLLTKSTRPKAH